MFWFVGVGELVRVGVREAGAENVGEVLGEGVGVAENVGEVLGEGVGLKVSVADDIAVRVGMVEGGGVREGIGEYVSVGVKLGVDVGEGEGVMWGVAMGVSEVSTEAFGRSDVGNDPIRKTNPANINLRAGV